MNQRIWVFHDKRFCQIWQTTVYSFEVSEKYISSSFSSSILFYQIYQFCFHNQPNLKLKLRIIILSRDLSLNHHHKK